MNNSCPIVIDSFTLLSKKISVITWFRTHGLLLFSEVQGEAMEPYCVSFDEVNFLQSIQWQHVLTAQFMNSILGGKELVYRIIY